MEAPETQKLHSALTDLEAQTPLRSQAFRSVVRCIGCIIARADSEEEAFISTPALVTCMGREKQGGNHKVRAELQRLTEVGLLGIGTADELPPEHKTGAWKASYTRFYKPTERGREVFPLQAHEDCNLRNPFVRLTPLENRIIDCARCILAKTTGVESDLANGFTANQIATCQQISISSAWHVLRRLHTRGAFEQEIIKQRFGPSRQAFYTLSPDALPWLAPKEAEHCQTPEIAQLPFTKDLLYELGKLESPAVTTAVTSAERTLPPEEMSALARNFAQVRRCVGCLAARQVPINTANIATCNGISAREAAFGKVNVSIRWLASIGLLAEYTLDAPLKTQAPNYQHPVRATHYRLTGLGSLLLPPEEQPECPSRNPFLLITDRQEKIVNCIRCVLARTAPDMPTSGGVTVPQIIQCRGQKGTALRMLAKLYDAGLIDKKTIPRFVPGSGQGPVLYWPTKEGEPWLSPKIADDCPSVQSEPAALPSTEPPRRTFEISHDYDPSASPLQALKSLPPATYENGSQLLESLNRTFYGSTTHLQLLKTMLRNRIKRNFQQVGTVFAEDVVQEVLMALAERKKEIEFPLPGIPIIFGITSNKVADVFQRHNRRPTSYLEELEPQQKDKLEADISNNSPRLEVVRAETREARQALNDLIARLGLSPVQAAIIESFAFGSPNPSREGIDAERIAARTGTTAGTVRVIAHRLRKKLREDKVLSALWLSSQ